MVDSKEIWFSGPWFKLKDFDGIDIMNEPEWVNENDECGQIPWDNFSYLLGKCAINSINCIIMQHRCLILCCVLLFAIFRVANIGCFYLCFCRGYVPGLLCHSLIFAS